MAGLLTLAWVDEVMPESRHTGDNGYGEPTDVVYSFPAEGLTVAMRNRLQRLVRDEVDSKGCDGEGCERGVGFVLHEDDDEPWRSGVQWCWTTVIESPDGRVLVVCEDCTPTNIYAAEA